MKKFYYQTLVTFGIMLTLTTTVEATPAFARQMDTSCMACHTQNIPKLNSFGREFKLSGFTMTGGIKEIADTANGGLSLPGNLNIGFVIKARIHDVNDNQGVHSTSTEIYDESAIIFGGKIADNVGTSMEFTNGLVGGKIAFTEAYDFGRIGASMFMTDALGAFSGTEIYSTGLYRPIRQFENRKKANIFQKLGIGAGAATGAQLYYSGNGIYATVGQYVPVQAASTDTTDGGFKVLARISYETNLGGYTVAVGGYYLGGDVRDNNATVGGKVNEVDRNSDDRESTGIDMQVEGNIDNMSLMLTGAYVISNEFTDDGLIAVGSPTSDLTGYSFAVQLNPIEQLGVKVAYLSYMDNNDAANDEVSYSIGADYNFRQNVRFTLEYSLTEYDAPNTQEQTDIIFMTMLAF